MQKTYGYIKTAAATPRLRVADISYNVEEMKKLIEEADARGVKVLVFPELSLTAYTCGDLFFQESLLSAAKEGLKELLLQSRGKNMLIFAGLPWEEGSKLYNVAAAFQNGKLLALIPKTNIPNYAEFYEARYFAPGERRVILVPGISLKEEENGEAGGETENEGSAKEPGSIVPAVPFGTDILLSDHESGLKIAAEICEDIWVPDSPSNRHAVRGANLIVNLSASNETAGKSEYRRSLMTAQSSRLVCGYIYASSGTGESTTDLVFGGHRMIAEDGEIIADSGLYREGLLVSDIDLVRLKEERRRKNTFPASADFVYGKHAEEVYLEIELDFAALEEKKAYETEKMNGAEGGAAAKNVLSYPLDRHISPHPFYPEDERRQSTYCRDIFDIQVHGLKKRMEHIGAKRAVIGLSGGLDSTLALLVVQKAYAAMGLPAGDILCITMPAFGTTDRTYDNACLLAKETGAELREINITESVKRHFEDIGHDIRLHNAAYENGQARERTQILMDIANDVNGIVIGTGDLSELALGWCTYNGDHMSMYAVNADVPKTLVRHLVRFAAEETENKKLHDVLMDILDTPVSPELLPSEAGAITQKTEDIVGPYELHDFFLYYMLRYGYTPARILLMAEQAFSGRYDRKTILKWMETFYRRFFSQQFKRSCSTDGVKVLSVDLSPRGGLRMPSDAVSAVWLSEIRMLME